jgi:hypothetical protein
MKNEINNPIHLGLLFMGMVTVALWVIVLACWTN